MYIYIQTEKAALKLTLEETGVLTVCEIQTLNLDDEDNVSHVLFNAAFKFQSFVVTRYN